MGNPLTGAELPPGELSPLPIDLSRAGPVASAKISIGKKTIMGWAGLLWVLFVVVHLLENMLLFFGADAYNGWVDILLGIGPLLYVLEAGLVVFLVLHVVFGVWVTLENWAARPVPYELDRKKGGRTFASNTMIWTGLILLLFLVLHLAKLKYGDHGHDTQGRLDLFTAVGELLRQPGWALWYIFGVCVVGVHVWHAVQSGLRTVGLNHEKYTPTVTAISHALGWIVALGYGAIPIWALLTKGGGA